MTIDIKQLIVDFRFKCINLGIPEYTNHLTDEEILNLALQKLSLHVEEFLSEITEDIQGE